MNLLTLLPAHTLHVRAFSRRYFDCYHCCSSLPPLPPKKQIGWGGGVASGAGGGGGGECGATGREIPTTAPPPV